ncbi:MAG: hypothetical protein NZ901_07665 [Geminocystis sp.]|nr:hypothetical protein [Geminocystis sp.]HIK36839.1 hypothetical protein [Geminocystis sp. M7585_C2015_104]MCS7148049.1 hypothetical protein [Geminocystis sp.]MCX8077793.1 hypothetical protein [Geminocystis sp.]MDW8116401.1 hypothetical protein [Geminocystis sp.]
MSFFKPQQPILQKKQLYCNLETYRQMRCVRVEVVEKLYLSGIYTCVDQAMLVWGLVTGIIFMGGQFLTISWQIQAIFWSILTLVGIIAMITLTHSWTVWEKITELLYAWVILMLLGMALTDSAIFLGWGYILSHLCHLWLILSAIGYGITGWMLHSRAFFLSALIHAIMVFLLPLFGGWQFAATGFAMTSNLWLFSEAQWDMLLPRELKQLKGNDALELTPAGISRFPTSARGGKDFAGIG